MAEQKRILIADDEPDFIYVLSVRLEVNGYEVITARDGEEALSKTKEEEPDLVILDLMMPKINGFEVCRMLKFDDAYKNIPIVILSALDQQRDRDKATTNGADAYFIKPFDLKLLLTKIEDLLKRGSS
ncbi:MAG: response regulator [Candidatus Omnitrophica bacterium]|nr:response regulator [Candidatus Omnitrophota bacterium]MDD5429831.1 response regulator [Candidatus Omnitrophota bacterium]